MTLPADGLPPLREVVARCGLDARKSLGQNFLFDLNLTGRIARAAGPLAGVAVVEVGPGPGGLTRALLTEGARSVIAIGSDEPMPEIRRCTCGFSSNPPFRMMPASEGNVAEACASRTPTRTSARSPGEITIAPVSVCQYVSTIAHLLPPTAS